MRSDITDTALHALHQRAVEGQLPVIVDVRSGLAWRFLGGFEIGGNLHRHVTRAAELIVNAEGERALCALVAVLGSRS